MAQREDKREIRETVADGEPMSREELAKWLLLWITGGDVPGYAKKIRARYEEAAKNAGSKMQEVRENPV